MAGHWQILGGHPGGMGPKKKRKGQYSPFVDYKEPKRWRKNMDLGKGPTGGLKEYISEGFDRFFESNGLDRMWTDKFGGETVGQFLDRHKEIKRIGDKYIFFHGRPKGSKYDELRIGTYLTDDIESAKHFASRDRNLDADKDIEVIRLELTPDEIEPGSFVTLRQPIAISKSMIMK